MNRPAHIILDLARPFLWNPDTHKGTARICYAINALHDLNLITDMERDIASDVVMDHVSALGGNMLLTAAVRSGLLPAEIEVHSYEYAKSRDQWLDNLILDLEMKYAPPLPEPAAKPDQPEQ